MQSGPSILGLHVDDFAELWCTQDKFNEVCVTIPDSCVKACPTINICAATRSIWTMGKELSSNINMTFNCSNLKESITIACLLIP